MISGKQKKTSKNTPAGYMFIVKTLKNSVAEKNPSDMSLALGGHFMIEYSFFHDFSKNIKIEI